MADEHIQGVPPGLTAEPIQGDPSGLTAEPIQQSAQVEGVPPGLTAEPVQPTPTPGSSATGISAHEPSLWERAKNVVTEGIPQFSHRTVYNPKYGQEQFLAPEEAMTPMEQSAHPILTGGLEIAGSLTSPENVSIMAATSGLGTLAGPEAKLASKVIPRLISAGFSIQQIVGAAKESGQAWDAIKRGDDSEALRLITHVVGDVGMAALAAQHASGVEAEPSTTIGRRLQGPVDAAAIRVSQAFKSDTRATASANAMRRAATVVFDQRLNEHTTAVDQAVQASKEAIDAKGSFENGQITQQQLDDYNNRASAAAANARKATQALSDAHESQAMAGAEVDRMNRKVQRSKQAVSEKQTKGAASARDDYKRAIPPAPKGKAAYTDRDLDIGDAYLENHHENVQAVGSVQDAYDAWDHIQKGMENQIQPHIEKYANEPIQTNVKMDVRDALEENPNRAFVEKGMQALEEYDLTDPTITEADRIRKNLTAANRAKLQESKWDISTAMEVDPAFAARQAALESLRNGIYNTLEDKDVQGIREIRQDEASVIRLRNAAERQLTKGDVKVRGSGGSGALLKMIGKSAGTLGAGTGAAIGGGIGFGIAGPVGAEVGGTLGAGTGAIYGKRLGQRIAPGDMTRNALIERRMKFKAAGVPMTEVQGPGRSPTGFMPNGAVPQRENTPLHSELSTHYGEPAGKTSYYDLEQRFMQDLDDKQRHGVPLESAEKQLLGKINQQNYADQLKMQNIRTEQEVSGKSEIPQATLPEDAESLMKVPQSNLAHGMDTHKGIVHDIAHAVVGSERGINFRDGIRSHLHAENKSSGSLMSAPIDWSDFVNEDGEVDPGKVKAKIADLAATYVAGGVANDLYHEIPFTENHHLGADVRILKSFLKNSGFSEAESMKMISQAADDAAQVLSRPGVQELIEKHAAVREPGLDERYHISPERMEQILQDVKGGENDTTGKSAGTSAASERGSEEAGTGTETKNKEGNTAELRSAKQGPSKGKGGSVRGSEQGNESVESEEPANPKLGTVSAEDESEDVESEYQTPLKKNYLMEITDQQGETRNVEIPGFSSKQAIKSAQKKFPDAQSWGIQAEKPGVAPTEYTVPKEKLLSVGGRAGEAKTDIQVLRHELGHAMLGLREGGNPRGVLRHTHPDMGGSGRAGVQWDNSEWVDPNTRRAIPEKVPGLLRRIMGGIAADEHFNNIPRGENHNLNTFRVGSDGSHAYRVLKNAGLDEPTTMSTIHRAIDQAKEYLTKPEISDIIKENESVREPGLSRQYHYSPERLKRMHLEAQRRIQNGESNNGPTREEAGTGRAGDVPGGEATAAAGSGEGVRSEESLNPKLGTVAVPLERTTGEHDEAIKAGGAIPGGVQKGDAELGIPDYPLFHDPQTGSTLALRADQVTSENVAKELQKSRSAFAVGNAVKSARETGGFTLNPKTGEVPKTGFMAETFPERREALDHPVTTKDIKDFIDKNKDVLDKHPELHVGGWQNELNISGRYGNQEDALAAAKKLDQSSVWDAKNKQEISTGGKNEQREFPEYSLEQRLADLGGTKPESPKLGGVGPVLASRISEPGQIKANTEEMPPKLPDKVYDIIDQMGGLNAKDREGKPLFPIEFLRDMKAVEDNTLPIYKAAAKWTDASSSGFRRQLQQGKDPRAAIFHEILSSIDRNRPATPIKTYSPVSDIKSSADLIRRMNLEGSTDRFQYDPGKTYSSDTLREIFGLPPSDSLSDLKNLQEKGIIEWDGKASGWRVIEPPLGGTKPENPKLSKKSNRDKQNSAVGFIDPTGQFEDLHPDAGSHDRHAKRIGYKSSDEMLDEGWVRKAGQGSYAAKALLPATVKAIEHDIILDLRDYREGNEYGQPVHSIVIDTNKGEHEFPVDDFIEKYNGDLNKTLQANPPKDSAESLNPKLSAKQEALDALGRISDNYGVSTDAKKVGEGAGFILPDGRFVHLGTDDHPQVLFKNGYDADSDDDRVPFINDTGAIRSNQWSGRQGKTLSYSVPKGGVTPEQIEFMKQGVGQGLGRNGQLRIETANNPSNIKSSIKDFATPSHVESMLHEIGAHPDQKSPDDMLRHELKTELGITGDDPRNGLPNKKLASLLKSQRELNPKLSRNSSVPLMEKPLSIKGTGEEGKINTVDVAKALSEFTRKKVGSLEMGESDDKQMVKRAKGLAEDEAKYQLNQANSGKAWYTTDIGIHDGILREMRPELADPAKLSLFKMSEAVLSSGQKPYSNLKAAIRAWDEYNENGKFSPTNPNTGMSWGPRNVSAYGSAIDSINRLISDKGEKGASDWLLSEHPLTELRQYMSESQTPVRGKASDMQPGAMILGAKRGPFAQNLHGIESAFTADMWVNRTWNRWMGTQEVQPDGELRDSPRNNSERNLMKQSFQETAQKLNMSTSSLQAVLWFYEQGLYSAHGVPKESWSFSDAAKRIQEEHKQEENEDFKFGANENKKVPESVKPAPAANEAIPGIDFLAGGAR